MILEELDHDRFDDAVDGVHIGKGRRRRHLLRVFKENESIRLSNFVIEQCGAYYYLEIADFLENWSSEHRGVDLESAMTRSVAQDLRNPLGIIDYGWFFLVEQKSSLRRLETASLSLRVEREVLLLFVEELLSVFHATLL